MRTALILAAWLLCCGARAQEKAATACDFCSGKKEISCPTCTGTGRATLDCPLCQATGTTRCELCNYKEEDDPEGRKVKIPRGRIPCLNRYCDKKGVVHWEGGKSTDPCKVCGGKGVFDCPQCDDGKRKCAACLGRGRFAQTCGDCAGEGKLPCPMCRASPTRSECVFCFGEVLRTCQICKGKPGDGAKCMQCLGVGKRWCDRCYGSAKDPCESCGGTGKIRSVTSGSEEKAGAAAHRTCDRQGYVACTYCSGGKTACKKCKDGIVVGACAWCSGAKKVGCRGCLFGSWAGLETLARTLHAGGRFQRASEFYDTAQKRFEPAWSRIEIEQTPDAEAGFKRMKDAMRKRLDAAAEACRDRKTLPK